MEPQGEARAVFVDPTGRRSRLVARTCWVLGTLGVAYVALVLVSLLLPPGLSRLTVPGLGAVLPGPAAAPLGALKGEPPEVLLAPTSRPSVTASPRPTARPTPAESTRPVPAGASPRPAPSRTGTAAPRPTTASTRAPTAAPGRPTTAPTQRATQAPAAPPGSTRTPKPRPSPTRGPR